MPFTAIAVMQHLERNGWDLVPHPEKVTVEGIEGVFTPRIVREVKSKGWHVCRNLRGRSGLSTLQLAFVQHFLDIVVIIIVQHFLFSEL